jgi:hypothetical protein
MLSSMSNATTESAWVHPFERGGLGKAPFQCTGYIKMMFQACPGAPVQCGGSCDFCGTGIMHSYTIVSSDGVAFKVGSDCVARTGDTQLIESLRAAERASEREYQRQEWERGAPERARQEGVREARRQAQAAINLRECAMVIEGAAVVLAWPGLSDWDRTIIRRLHDDLVSGGREAGVVDAEWLCLSMAYRCAALPVSHQVGEVNDRLRNLVCLYEGGPTIGMNSQWGLSVLAKFRVLEGPMAGALLVWKTGHYPAKRGSTVTLTATVKGHGDYKGTAQTFVTRGVVTVVL